MRECFTHFVPDIFKIKTHWAMIKNVMKSRLLLKMAFGDMLCRVLFAVCKNSRGESMFLENIIEAKKKEVARLKEHTSPAREAESIPLISPARDFKAALRSRDCAIIAEIKRRSPSRGNLREDLDPGRMATLYEQNGAVAVSVLTDASCFGAQKQDIPLVKQAIGLPVLRKDFIIDPCQIHETRAMGADSLLLIARLLEAAQLRDFVHLTRSMGMHPLVEIRTPGDLDKALHSGAEIIGINNRNLETFTTDLRTTLDLAPRIPRDRLVVSESGIHSREHIKTLMSAGIHAFLIGEVFMLSPDTGKKLGELQGT